MPEVPWEVTNSIRNLNPMDPAGSTNLFNSIAPDGTPTNPIVNQLVNYGWQYVWHCHILSHEEMDMMRPQSLVLPPVAPSNLANTLTGTNPTRQRAVLTWDDNSITETGFQVQRSTNLGSSWTTIRNFTSPLDQPNTHRDGDDLHRHVDVQPDHHDALLPGGRATTRSATSPTPPTRR